NKEEYIWNENSNSHIIIEHNNNHDVKVQKTCVLNGNVNLCDCQTNFRSLLKNCDNSYLFCDRESSCRDCEETFYPEHGFGYKCKCNGITKDFICKDQAELIEALVLIIQALFIFIFCSTIVCCCVCCIGYFTIKGCKNTITKLFKSDRRVINLYQMVPNDQSPTVYSNRNKLELNEYDYDDAAGLGGSNNRRPINQFNNNGNQMFQKGDARPNNKFNNNGNRIYNDDQGRRVIIKADGSKIYDDDLGRRLTKKPDGSEIFENYDGRKLIILPNGNEIYEHNDGRRIYNFVN
ncbi:unnamed protein product, partial [Brachionus calyciflorus]